ncbi:hypothetical protein DFJ73DRAFT_771574 [Zopfochytrium polystomum]|nr:hypothetical protein DFJ73DRAFT_771574 [Zopfochytrium polystomum]
MLALVLWMKPQWIIQSTTRKQRGKAWRGSRDADTSQDRLADDEAMVRGPSVLPKKALQTFILTDLRESSKADETRTGDQPLDQLLPTIVSQSSPFHGRHDHHNPPPPKPSPSPPPPPPLAPSSSSLATLFTLTSLSLLALFLSTPHPTPTPPSPAPLTQPRLAKDLATITPHRKPFPRRRKFGLTATSNVRDLLAAVTTANASCVGAMLWSLRFRARDGGFYVHDEGGGYEAYHDRGGAGMGAGLVRGAGFGADEGAVMALMRGAAAAVSGVVG